MMTQMQFNAIQEREKEITKLRKTVVRIYEYLESAADSEMIPMWMFEEITKIIERAEGQ